MDRKNKYMEPIFQIGCIIVAILCIEQVVNEVTKIFEDCISYYREANCKIRMLVFAELVKSGKPPALAKRDVIVMFDL